MDTRDMVVFMKKGLVLMVAFSMVMSMYLLPFPTGALRYGMDQDLGGVDASFRGVDNSAWSGVSVAGAGDVNGDG